MGHKPIATIAEAVTVPVPKSALLLDITCQKQFTGANRFARKVFDVNGSYILVITPKSRLGSGAMNRYLLSSLKSPTSLSHGPQF